MRKGWAVLVVWLDGQQEFVKGGAHADGEVAVFRSRTRAQGAADFFRMGIEDEVQSINVVRAPASHPTPGPVPHDR